MNTVSNSNTEEIKAINKTRMKAKLFFYDYQLKKGDVKAGDTVLILCGGTGLEINKLSKIVGNNGRVIVVDYSEEMVHLMKLLVRKMALSNVELFQMDVTNLNFSKGSFDHIFCNFSMQYFSNQESLINNWSELLKNGGTINILEWLKPTPDIIFTNIQKLISGHVPEINDKKENIINTSNLKVKLILEEEIAYPIEYSTTKSFIDNFSVNPNFQPLLTRISPKNREKILTEVQELILKHTQGNYLKPFTEYSRTRLRLYKNL
ncbi:class I SAM-dependent methyltransferase [Bacillus sp. JJ1562]|uniref:class I SAM-dependent methyltransferase n=1 Tax=Bacillus sp. JJ1562 TaxID=3122960 RepID=UPI003002CB5B